MGTLWQDVRHAFRMLARNPGLTAVVVLTFALCIGATTAIFSAVNNVLLNPLPQKDSTGLIYIGSFDKERGMPSHYIDGPTWEELRHLESVFADLVTFRGTSLRRATDDFVEDMWGCKVSPGFFRFWQVPPLLGRTFTADEGRPGAPPVIVLSHQFWRSRCGGRPDIVGQSIQCKDEESKDTTFTIIGVMPRHARFPSDGISFWLPWEGPHADPEFQATFHGYRNYNALAQVVPGVARNQLQSILTAISERQAKDDPEQYRNYTIQARPLRELFSSDQIRETLGTLFGVIGFVLLIACANIASLLLARNEARQRELAMRAALGAARHRLIRLLLTESTLLSMLGGFSGLLVAWVGTGLLRTLIPTYMPSMRPVGIDGPMLSFTLVISLMAGLAVGLVPALFCSGRRIGEFLKEAATSASLSAGRRLVGRLFVVSELALAVILLAGAGLMINSVIRLLNVDPGFDPADLAKITMPLWGEYGGDPRAEPKDRLARQMAERLASLPGVKMVGVTGEKRRFDKYLPEGSDQAKEIDTQTVDVEPCDGLRAMGMPLLAGRYFDAGDQVKGQNAVIVNETLARRCWPGQSAIGKTLRFENRILEVIGVVGDVRDSAYGWRPDPTCYRPFQSHDMNRQWYSLLVRTRVDPASLVPVLRQEIKAIAPGITRPSFQVVEQLLYDSTADKRAYMSYLGGFAAVGLFLSAMGINGLLAWTVVRQTKEIGIRMALGARPGSILRMVLRDGLTMILTGLVLGIAGALALTRVISGFLYEVSPTDPATFAAVALFLIAVSLLACYLPARRATRIDPMVALRYE